MIIFSWLFNLDHSHTIKQTSFKGPYNRYSLKVTPIYYSGITLQIIGYIYIHILPTTHEDFLPYWHLFLNWTFYVVHPQHPCRESLNCINAKNPRSISTSRISHIRRRLPTLPQYAVPSAWRSLTSLFGMGRGGTFVL